uniref:SGTA homodimerisation domain-containing protein n=1 Tax=Glossina austeni TaxID=7395 RepID=A0A1A9V6Z1_GLOAU
MTDEVQQNFVRCFISYLKKQVDSQAFSADAQESAEVAIQCLAAAFDIGDERDEPQEQAESSAGDATGSSSIDVKAWNPKDINLFEIFEMHYMEKNPENLKLAETIKNEGNRLMKEGKYNEALLQYNRAITYDPKNPIFYCNRAAAYIRLGENERAVVDCKLALVYNPNYGKAYGRLGIAYSNLLKYEEAQQAYSKAIELEPDNQDYRNNLEVARNARNHAQNNFIPQLTGGLNVMFSNPAIRQLFSSAEIDLEQLQSMSQNPMVVNAIRQVFANIAPFVGASGAGSGASPNAVPPMPNDILQLFQTYAQQLATATGNSDNPANTDNNPNDQQQQPPPPPPENS